MKRWTSLNQIEMDLCCKKLAERMEEEVLDKYNVEESKRGAFKGRGNSSEWRRAPRLKEGDLEKATRLYKAKTGVGCDGFHPKVPRERNERKSCGVSREGGAEWQMAATILYDHVFLDTEECYK